ncbi:MAG: methionine adenosyltransferase [Actinobacteria bacterium]|nr:MAG: methionine adenosyltransferase [Actinomycetota bacterium]TMM22704.1 MAG: methionine adenosyltransferase [Actinomycetota bacterium]
MSKGYLFSSESVTEGHPDKLADQISDAVLDAMLAKDPNSRVACETLVTTGVVFVSGEITTEGYVDIPSVVRNTVVEVGYTDARFGLDGYTCGVITAIQEQSPDIAIGVEHALEEREEHSLDALDMLGAGDQGMMFGYACRETDELMPLPIALAHRLARRLSDVRKAGIVPYLRPDGKSQVSVEYVDGKPTRVDTVLISAQHREEVDVETLLRPDVEAEVIDPVLREFPELTTEGVRVLVNPTGRFEVGGPKADTGLTGRKIIVDSYGGMAPHGGGAFSGKDPTKVDRSGAYMTRYVAKNVVAAGLADRCLLQVAYAIGTAHPVSLMVDSSGTEQVDPGKLQAAIWEIFDFRPAAIIRDLDLARPIYQETAAYGHFGRKEFPWEATDRVDALRSAVDA